ncbi:glycosyltransferase [Alteromonas sp. H39]|uniref:glycosyltransferase n=1 Tax=Alteromonas sp. H39 TaxID=3389876 RepID=UPI0039DFF3F5
MYRKYIVEPKLVKALQDSNIFDSEWYLKENEDVKRSGVKPEVHFIRFGAGEGRLPHRQFNLAIAHSDLSQQGQHLLAAFLLNNTNDFSSFTDNLSSSCPYTSVYNCTSYPRVSLSLAAQTEFLNSVITVIIPVFNAFDELAHCLHSLTASKLQGATVIVINDASTEEGFNEIADKFRYNNFEFMSNDNNLGFSGTVNKGIRTARSRVVDSDIVILNSDTQVSSHWLRELKLIAKSSPETGTVTSVSNSAGPFSVHTFLNSPSLDEINAVASSLRENAPLVSVSVPTGHGFCMYINGRLIDEIGLFDDIAFPKGYGEENDFCMRAIRHGWRNKVALRSFVYHKKNASFGTERVQLLEKGRAIIDERYPNYSKLVQSTFSDISYTELFSHLKHITANSSSLPLSKSKLLFVISTETGGTPQTNFDLMKQVASSHECFLLVSDSSKIRLYWLQDLKLELIESHYLNEKIDPSTHKSVEYDAVVAAWLGYLNISLVHIRHMAWHSYGLIDICKNIEIPVVFSIHDFYTVCPTVKLLDGDKKFCGGKCTNPSEPCKPELWKAEQVGNLNHFEVFPWQAIFRRYINEISHFVTTSESAKKIIEDSYPSIIDSDFSVIPHGRDFEEFQKVASYPEENKKFKLICPGNIGAAKGLKFISDLATIGHDVLEVHIVGKVSSEVELSEHIVVHGAYEREELASIIKSIRPTFGGVFSIWPETWCHTLTELLASGIPVFSFGMGAVEERINKGEFGWVLSSSRAIDLVNKLNDTSFKDEWESKLENVYLWQCGEGKELTTKAMSHRYLEIYNKLI